MKVFYSLTCILFLSFITPLAFSGEGHSHGNTPTAAPSMNMLRFYAISEDFELVGVVNKKHLILYLDHRQDGSPVLNAKLDIEIDGVQVPVTRIDEGEFEVLLTKELPQGTTNILATVIAGSVSDLLTVTIDVHAPSDVESQGASTSWQQYLVWFGALILACVLLLLMIQRVRHPRQYRQGDIA
jgi:hypothetical protein